MRSTPRLALVLGVLFSTLLALPGCWNNDDDKDNIKNDHDPCPSTPFGAKFLTRGCSATDLVLDPTAMVGEAFEAFEQLSQVLDTKRSLPEVVDALGEGTQQLRGALGTIRHSDVCEGSAELGDALRTLQSADAAMRLYVAALQDEIPMADRDDENADVDEQSADSLWWQLQSRLLAEGVVEVEEGKSLADNLCQGFRDAGEVKGIVESFDSSSGIMKLTSGETIVIAASTVQEQGMTDGSQVAVDIMKHVNGDLLAKSTHLFPSPWPYVPGLVYDFCIGVRVTPVQPKPLDPANWLKHRFSGYEDGGIHYFEEGMRIATFAAFCPGPLDGQGPGGEDVLLKYSLEVELNYKTDGGVWVTTLMASNLGDLSDPAKLPEDADPFEVASLTVRTFKRTCLEDPTPEFPGDFNCSDAVEIFSDIYDIMIRPAYTNCYVYYDETVFDLEDDEPNDWRSATVDGLLMNSPGAGSASFTARGRKIVNGSPTMGDVGLNQPFAIYNDDPFGIAGTNKESGLSYPHANGTRNGKPYQYACNVPRVVRDAVGFCSGVPDTFYRLPFLKNFSTEVTQGNGGSFTHSGGQWFALDFSGAQGFPLLAARGGTVIDVRSNVFVNCQATPYSGCPNFGNYVAIQHQDGEISWYLHMVMNSATVVIGQKVKRGHFIGQLGNTGNSTGPHLHFHVTTTTSSSTQLVTYEYESVLPPKGTCAVPFQGQVLYSTNELTL